MFVTCWTCEFSVRRGFNLGLIAEDNAARSVLYRPEGVAHILKRSICPSVVNMRGWADLEKAHAKCMS